jgi:protein SCO1/2
MTSRFLVASALSLTLAGACVVPAVEAHEGHTTGLASLEMLRQTVVPIENSGPLDAATLVGTDGKPAATQLLRGHWSLVYFGFTSCRDVCPTTLQTLATVARDPASGVAEGRTSIVFVSVDPAHDTPARLKSYLSAFDARIVGLAGETNAVKKFSTAAGAAYAPGEEGLEHSTSVFVLDEAGRPVAVMLRPSNPKRIVADLKGLRASHDPKLAQGR